MPVIVDVNNLALANFVEFCIEWVELSSWTYLGIYIVKSRNLKCLLDAAKRGFYRAANSIFGKVGRIASEEVVIHLIRTKCVPILLYGLEALPLNKSQLVDTK